MENNTMELDEIWRKVLGELEVTLSKANFQTWFRATFLADIKKGVFTIGVPSFFYEDYFRKKYLKEITKALEHHSGEEVTTIKFKHAAPPPGTNVFTDKSKVIHRPVDNPGEKSPIPRAQSLPSNSTLNNDYLLENFVVGASNQLAVAAAQAVMKNPGTLYSPLFIYGDSGLGKTHLMQAIGHGILHGDPSKKILYVSCETFINDFIGAVEAGHGKAKDFKDRYRNVDVLLIDDIQFLGRKESTQEEFFHTFNHLHQNKKQVVLTADCPPKMIKGLENRLQTRFEGGMVTDISQPDLETREAILRQKAKRQGKEIDDDIIHCIAENIQSSIRELEGVLTKVIATCELTNCTITPDRVMEIIGGTAEEKKRAISADLIIREVHRYYRVPIEDILGQKRNKEIVVPRQITMYLIRTETDLSFPEIGRKMSGRDHSTIIHGCEKIEAEMNVNSRIKDDILILKERIYSALK